MPKKKKRREKKKEIEKKEMATKGEKSRVIR